MMIKRSALSQRDILKRILIEMNTHIKKNDSLDIQGIIEFIPSKYDDDRGFFSETFNSAAFAEAGIRYEFVQDNHSLSIAEGTVRGLHFQIPPFAQAKLVRVTRGAIFDVAVDIRQNSTTYGQHVSSIISAEAWNQVLVPEGFAHGFCTLEPNTEVLYKVSAPYSPEHDRGLLWSDLSLGIDWPVTSEMAVVSDKDKNHPALADLPTYFRYS